jgi:cysteine desulfurase / selenocysteine lyase
MSTPDLPGAPPSEVVLAEGQLPRPSETPTTRAPTPGVALAGARFPGGPTLPDPASAVLTSQLAQLANEMFAPSPPADVSTSPIPAASAPGIESASTSPATPALGFAPPAAVEAPQRSLTDGLRAEPSRDVTAHAPRAERPVGDASSLEHDRAPRAGLAQYAREPRHDTAAARTEPHLDGARPEHRRDAPAPYTERRIDRTRTEPRHDSPRDARRTEQHIDGAAEPRRDPPAYVPLREHPVDGAPRDEGMASSPFHGPVSFDVIDHLSAYSLPVLDREEGAIPQVGAPLYWASAPRGQAAPVSIETFQIEPTDDRALRSTGGGAFDPNAIRSEFPILDQRVNGKPLVWLDNAATTQKPRAVIDRVSYYYEHENSNIHRAAHTLAARATDAYESARETVRRFIGARSKDEIVFVRGATEGINLVAQSWGRRNVGEGDEIVLTTLEHHANIVPWQRLCSETGARLRVAPVDDRGRVILEEYDKLLCDKTRIVAFTQVSNALGTITEAAEMIALAHRHGALVLLDGAQAVSHMPVDVQQLDCDFYVLSGHKVFAPTGIGVVFGKRELLDAMPPWQGGGNMIQDVTFERTLYQGPPARFEAGTGNIADAIGLGTALDWLMRIGVANVERYEHELLVYATERLLRVPGLKLIGTAPHKAGVLSFVLDGQKTEEVGGILDQEGIAVRSGHHCAQPILRRFGVEATVRASLAPYNTFGDIDALVAALHRLQTGQLARSRAS